MWLVLGVLLLVAVGNAVFFTLRAGKEISYSEFKTRVRDGKVQEVTVAEDRVQGMLKADEGQGRAFVAVRIEDPKLVEDLEKHGV